MTASLVDVALLAYGGPEGPEQIVPFLERLMGRAPDPGTVAAVKERYALIGGASPLPAITARQALALQARLAQELAFPIRVRHGFLYTEPGIVDCVRKLDAREVVALPMSPFSSRLTSGRYKAQLAAAEDPATGGQGRDIPLLEGWYASQGFVRTISRRAAEALDGCDVNEWAVLFTAHSVPAETIAEGDPYVDQLQQTISQLVPQIVPGDWRFGFQSKGRGGGEWMGPEADDAVRVLAEEGWRKILVVPVGFVSDNVETLYDLDIVLRAQIENLGIEYRRSHAPNDSPFFIEALAGVVTDYLAHRQATACPGAAGRAALSGVMAGPFRIVVVGGGMAGLGAARALEAARAQDPTIDWQLYEQDPRFGGKVHTVRRDGFVVEGGPDSAIIEKHWPITAARELGIADRFLDCNEDIRKSFVFTRGRLHELPEGIILMVPTRMVPFALSGLMSWPGKVRMGLDLLLPRGGAATGGPAGAAGPALDESLGDFVRRRLGKEALQRIAEPIVAGIHAGDPEQMSVRATFPMFLDMEREHRSLILAMLKRRKARQKAGGPPSSGASGVTPAGARPPGPRSYFYSFRGGLQDLSDAIVASLPAERLHAGVGVECMAASVTGGAQAGSRAYTLELGDGSRVVADAVVLATPAWASGDLLRPVAPLAATDLSSIEYVTTATASVAYRADQVGHDLKGFGFVVPRAEDRPVMATTWSSSKFDGRAPAGHVLLRSFLGRAGREAAAQLDDEEMAAVVRAELRDIMGISAEPEFVEIFRWPRGMPQYRVGHVELVAHIEAAVARVPGIELAGGAYHGIGIGDCLREGGAAAERALEHVRGLPEDAIPPQPQDLPAADGLED